VCLPSDGGLRGGELTLRWRILRDGPLPGAENMARDHALTRIVASGEGLLRLYRWDRPTLSLGRNEPTPGALLAEAGLPWKEAAVRRPTGGRMVLHDRELTYAVVVPAPRGGRGGQSPRQLYRAVHEGIAQGLNRLGIPALVVEAGAVLPPDAGPCFDLPVAGEITLGGRKLVGSAQARLEAGLLQHGSILLEGGQSGLETLLGPGAGAACASLADGGGRVPGLPELEAALVDGLRQALGGEWRDSPWRPEDLRVASALRPRYLDPEWTFRR